MSHKPAPFRIALLSLVLAGCAGALTRRVVRLDLAESRLANLSVTEKTTGAREFFLFAVPRRTTFLEGYIQGMVTDYGDNPIPGVVVRAVLGGERPKEGEAAPQAPAEAVEMAAEGASFDPGVSDGAGIYRIRFQLPLVKGVVDARGRLLVNPGWERDKENLGRAYEPQQRESAFRLYFDGKSGLVAFAEGVRKVIVQPSLAAPGAKPAPLPGQAAPAPTRAPERPAARPAAAPEETDLFRGFGLGAP